MATFIGAISKSKGSSKSEVIKSLKTIISELNKLEKVRGFKGIFLSASYFNELQVNLEQALNNVQKGTAD